MDVYTVEAFGKKVNVSGTVYLNGKPIESVEYDEVLFLIVMPDDEARIYDEYFLDKRVLAIKFTDFERARLLQELGY